MSEHSAVLTERHGSVLVLRLNRPDARNAINGDIARGLEAGLDELERDDTLGCGVLAANGPIFSAGADLKLVASGQAAEMATPPGGFGGSGDAIGAGEGPGEPVPSGADDAGHAARLGHHHGPAPARADQHLDEGAAIGDADRRPHLVVGAGKAGQDVGSLAADRRDLGDGAGGVGHGHRRREDEGCRRKHAPHF